VLKGRKRGIQHGPRPYVARRNHDWLCILEACKRKIRLDCFNKLTKLGGKTGKWKKIGGEGEGEKNLAQRKTVLSHGWETWESKKAFQLKGALPGGKVEGGLKEGKAQGGNLKKRAIGNVCQKRWGGGITCVSARRSSRKKEGGS